MSLVGGRPRDNRADPCVNALLGKFLLSSLFWKNYCYRVFELLFVIGMAPPIFTEYSNVMGFFFLIKGK